MPKSKSVLTRNIFINCPFDKEYVELYYSIVFTVLDCGFIPRCSREKADSSEVRVGNIISIMEDCQFGIHDISRTEIDQTTGFPRFNMAFELGLFMGMKRRGGKTQAIKKCLIMDSNGYRFRNFLSDISGQDPEAHNNQAEKVVQIIRNWLKTETLEKIPGPEVIKARYLQWRQNLPDTCIALGYDLLNIPFPDLTEIIGVFQAEKPISPDTQSKQ